MRKVLVPNVCVQCKWRLRPTVHAEVASLPSAAPTTPTRGNSGIAVRTVRELESSAARFARGSNSGAYLAVLTSNSDISKQAKEWMDQSTVPLAAVLVSRGAVKRFHANPAALASFPGLLVARYYVPREGAWRHVVGFHRDLSIW